MSEAEAVRIRGLLWPAELLELRAIYDARVPRRPTAAAMAVIGVLHDAARRGERVEQDELARRAGAGTGTVVRVLGHLRAAGVVTSEGGEFVPRRGKATCQRHRLTASPALVEVTTPDRQLRLRAYAWLTGEGGMAPDDARALLRSPAWQRELWRRLRAVRGKAVLNNRTDLTAVPNTAVPPASSCAPASGTDSWGTSATLEGSALQVAPVPRNPDREESAEDAERVTPVTPLGDPSGTAGAGPPRPGRRGAWVDPAVLAAVVDEAARRVGERDLVRTAAALLTEARRAGIANPERALAIAYDQGAAEAIDEAEVRSGRPGCRPVRDQAALAFAIACRKLRGERPPPWPAPRWPRVMPAASRAAASAPRPSLVGPCRDGSAQEARNAPPPLAEFSLAAEAAAWKALSAEERAQAEATVRREEPALARWTEEDSPIWRLKVLAVVRGSGGDPGGMGDGG